MKMKITGGVSMDFIDKFEITESDRAIFEQLTRPELLKLDNEQKLKYFYSFQVRHNYLKIVTDDFMFLSKPYNETSIIFIIGSTGVGKTTVSKLLLKQLLEKNKTENIARADIPYIYLKMLSNGHKAISWFSIYNSMLLKGKEILIKKKIKTIIKDGKVSVDNSSSNKIDALRDSLDSMIKRRNVNVLVIDEAYHLLRFGNLVAIMDTLKSISEIKTGFKLVLIGSYNLINLAKSYGQVCRRAEILHFKRYNIKIPNDVEEFTNIIKKLQKKWPCEVIPDFTSISCELMNATLGCIGLLKGLLLRALQMQLKKHGIWNNEYLVKAAKSIKLIDTIRSEIVRGEEDILGAAYGESYFSEEILNSIKSKMKTVTCKTKDLNDDH
jgi:energy-coupling factor transporter ATP-binding protein EcfA2